MSLGSPNGRADGTIQVDVTLPPANTSPTTADYGATGTPILAGLIFRSGWTAVFQSDGTTNGNLEVVLRDGEGNVMISEILNPSLLGQQVTLTVVYTGTFAGVMINLGQGPDSYVCGFWAYSNNNVNVQATGTGLLNPTTWGYNGGQALLFDNFKAW